MAEDKTLIRKTVQRSFEHNPYTEAMATPRPNYFCCCLNLRSFRHGAQFQRKGIFYTDYGQDGRFSCSLNKCRRCECVSLLWLFRFLFRFLDISSRMSILLISWIILGGFAVCVLLIFEFAILFFSTEHYKSFGWLNNIIIFPINTEKKGKKFTEFYVIYRIISNLIIILLCYVFGFIDSIGKCITDACDPYHIRHGILTNNDSYDSALFALLIYSTSLYVLAILPGILYLIAAYLVDTSVYANQGHDIEAVIKMHDWVALIELIEFGFSVDKSFTEKRNFEELYGMVTEVGDRLPFTMLDTALDRLFGMTDHNVQSKLNIAEMLFIVHAMTKKYPKSRINSKSKTKSKTKSVSKEFVSIEQINRVLKKSFVMPKVSPFAYLSFSTMSKSKQMYYVFDRDTPTRAVSVLQSLCNNINDKFGTNGNQPITIDFLLSILNDELLKSHDILDENIAVERASVLLQLIHRLDKNYLKYANYLSVWDYLQYEPPHREHEYDSLSGKKGYMKTKDNVHHINHEMNLNTIFDIISDCGDKIFDIAQEFKPNRISQRHVHGPTIHNFEDNYRINIMNSINSYRIDRDDDTDNSQLSDSNNINISPTFPTISRFITPGVKNLYPKVSIDRDDDDSKSFAGPGIDNLQSININNIKTNVRFTISDSESAQVVRFPDHDINDNNLESITVRNIIFCLLPIKNDNVIKRSSKADKRAIELICNLIPYLNQSYLIIYFRLISCFDVAAFSKSGKDNQKTDQVSVNLIACLCCFCDLRCVKKYQ